MNKQAINSIAYLNKRITHIIAVLCFVALPAISICQPAGPGDAGNPDEVVPFDSNMNLVFLGVGLVFAAIVVIKQLKQKKTANI